MTHTVVPPALIKVKIEPPAEDLALNHAQTAVSMVEVKTEPTAPIPADCKPVCL